MCRIVAWYASGRLLPRSSALQSVLAQPPLTVGAKSNYLHSVSGVSGRSCSVSGVFTNFSGVLVVSVVFSGVLYCRWGSKSFYSASGDSKCFYSAGGVLTLFFGRLRPGPQTATLGRWTTERSIARSPATTPGSA